MSDIAPPTVWPAWLRFGDDASDRVRDLDVAFGQLLYRQAPQADVAVLRLAVWCSALLGQGHACLDLGDLYPEPAGVFASLPAAEKHALRAGLAPALAACREQVAAAPFVGTGAGDEPLVLEDERLYLARYWRAAVRIRRAITERLAPADATAGHPEQARPWFARLFPDTPSAAPHPDWQKIACATALTRRFTILTGGPGTGKTRTVVCLLALLHGLAHAQGQAAPRIRLAAPTGKAAARLAESLAVAVQGLQATADASLAAVLAGIPTCAGTLHRLLGIRPDTGRRAHDADRPLRVDVLVIDEASMMDVEMMDAALAALPPHARLILLGDKDQLASVEAGAVLGELCRRAEGGHYWPAQCRRLQALCGEAVPARWQDENGTPLDQAIVMLRHSYRFAADSGIGQFARAVHAGHAPQVLALLARAPHGLRQVTLAPAPQASGDWLRATGILDEARGYPAMMRLARTGAPGPDDSEAQWDAWAGAVLEQQSQLQVLSALRAGPWGVQGLNTLIESRLRAEGWIDPVATPWYPGRPVMVLRNQPALGLANGDIGVVLSRPDPARPDGLALRVAFAGAQPGRVRWISPARLPDVESVLAMTVHKSQGSEFDHVVLVLPPHPSPLLTRELLYTGATRARRQLTLVTPAGDALLRQAIERRTRRATGVWVADDYNQPIAVQSDQAACDQAAGQHGIRNRTGGETQP